MEGNVSAQQQMMEIDGLIETMNCCQLKDRLRVVAEKGNTREAQFVDDGLSSIFLEKLLLTLIYCKRSET